MNVFKTIAGLAGSLVMLCVTAAMIQSAGSQMRIVPARVGAAGVTGTVPGRRPSTLPATVLLQGSVIDMGNAASGTMTIRVGNSTTTSQVALPDYQLLLAGGQAEDMVSLELQTPGYRYKSILGSYGRMIRMSGGDGIVNPSELDRLRLTPFSTALEFFVRFDLGGRLPATDQEHELFIRSVVLADVETAATTLTALSDGIVALPPAVNDGYALIADRSAYRAFLAQHPNVANSPRDRSRIPKIPLQAGHVPQRLWLSGTFPKDTSTNVGPTGDILIKTSTGYELHMRTALQDPTFNGVFVDGKLRLDPQQPIFLYDEFVERPYGPNGQVIQVRARTELVAEVFSGVFAGDKYALWERTSEMELSYPDHPQVAHEPRTISSMHLASNLTTVGASFSRLEPIGKRALPTVCVDPGVLTYCEYAAHNFARNGSGSTENVGRKVDNSLEPIGAIGGTAFQWRSTGRGSFQVITPAATTTFWSTDFGNQAFSYMVHLTTSGSGDQRLTLAGATAMIKADSTAGFFDIEPEGAWRYGSFVQSGLFPYAYNTASYPRSTTFIRDSNGTGVRKTRSEDPAFSHRDDDLRSGWRLLDGRLYDTRYDSDEVYPQCVGGVLCSGFTSCEEALAAGAQQCMPVLVRYFRPLARSGNSLYGIEEVYANDYTSFTPPYSFFSASRPNVYTKLP